MFSVLLLLVVADIVRGLATGSSGPLYSGAAGNLSGVFVSVCYSVLLSLSFHY